MAKHPSKRHEEHDEDYDSNRHREAGIAKIQAENKEIAEDKEIASFKGLPQEGETRDELIARIRKLREEKPVEVVVETFRSEGLQKEFDAEQEAGRAAVAKAEAQAEKYREFLQKEAEGEKNQAG
jgi:hypothetical protein